jgi:hypothetical protein
MIAVPNRLTQDSQCLQPMPAKSGATCQVFSLIGTQRLQGTRALRGTWAKLAACAIALLAFPCHGATGPKIVFADPIYDFGTVNAGKEYDHRYYFTNSGDQTLLVTNVHSTCGCAVAGEWSKSLEPGESGSVPIKVNSTKILGAIQKSVVVFSNDKEHPITELTIRGKVGNPIEYAPKWAYFNVPLDATAVPPQVVKLTNSALASLAVYGAASSTPAFRAEIITNTPGRDYHIAISVVPPFASGITKGEVVVNTSSPDMPKITFSTMANVQSAVSMMPSRILLPSGPLPNAVTNSVIIQYTGTNAFRLTDPAVNANAVKVRLTELKPGKIFQAALMFPKGFQVAAPVEFTVKTSDPRQSILRAPVVQQPAGASK